MVSDMTDAFPLQWPAGWPRTPAHKQDGGNRFQKRNGNSWGGRPTTFAEARDSLFDELLKLGAKRPVVSTNHPVNKYGVPTESKRRVQDEAVAIYFEWNGKPMVMARDAFDNAASNMRSLALAVEAMRQLERHGGGIMMERAFAGFTALPSAASCWDVLGVKPDATTAEVNAAFRDKARAAHPDSGGSDDAMTELNRAREAALDYMEG